jgi:hypothetical protein
MGVGLFSTGEHMADIRDAFPSKYLKASDLKGRPVVVQIDRVEYEPVGQEKQMKPILHFAGKDKGLVLNKTNCNAIMQITQSPDTDDWAGVAVTIYPTETAFGGEQVECIRIKKAPPAPKAARPAPQPEPEPAHDHSMTDDDVPFAWLLPLVLPMLGGLSYLVS